MVPENDPKPPSPSASALTEDELRSLRSIAALGPSLAALLQQKPPSPNDNAASQQVAVELKRQHAEKERAFEERLAMRDAEIFRLRKQGEGKQALIEAGFKSAWDVLLPHLVSDLSVTVDEKSTESPFRTVVLGPGGVERHTVGRDKSDAGHPMTVTERALEMAQDPKWKRFLDADTGKDKNKPKLPQNVSVPSQAYQAAQHQQQSPQQSPQQFPADMDPVEMLVLARGGTL